MVQPAPASVFMGDTGSLTIGGIIAVLAIAVRKRDVNYPYYV
jgi:UDP-N-acetylmuramyl pentapeptide phosphotransferase/UDP-N-acetylglucosamine-1-phosphate transferase